MEREIGTHDDRVQVVGGELDGATGRVVSTLQLPDGTQELTLRLDDDGGLVTVVEKATRKVTERELGSPG